MGLDPAQLINHWGYAAIFFVVILGNAGLPVPEETILLLAGYLVWDGRLHLPLVLAIGILSAVLGDNIGYWIGRELGRPALERYGHWILLKPNQLEKGRRLVDRYGASAVFAARFLPGLRFLAGPVAGVSGLGPVSFFAANLLGAACYVPLAVGIGYTLGYGFMGYVPHVERMVGRIEHLALAVVLALTLLLLCWRLARSRIARPPRPSGGNESR